MSILFNGNAFRLELQDSVPVVVEESGDLYSVEEAESEDEEEVRAEDEEEVRAEDENEEGSEDEDDVGSEGEEEEESEDHEEGGQSVHMEGVESEVEEGQHEEDAFHQVQPTQTTDTVESNSHNENEADFESPQYFLIQSKESLKNNEFDALKSHDVHFMEYLSGNAWLCRFGFSNLSAIQGQTFIKAVLAFPPEPKLPPYLKKSGQGDSEYEKFKSEEVQVDLILHDDSAESVALQICRALNIDDDPESIIRNKTTIRITVRGDQLEEIAKHNHVRAIEEVVNLELHNNVARNILGFDDLSACDGKNLDLTGFEGQNEIVTVADTGFDTGDKTSHPAFKDRVVELIAVGGSDTCDANGHGTHVCGSVLGSAWSDALSGWIKGTAPKANLIVQALMGDMNPKGETPLFGKSNKTLADLLEIAYHKGSRIHTNSWGPGWTKRQQLPYNDTAKALDDFVWKHQSMVVCFSAGNNGGKQSNTKAHIGSQAAAKNCITVGSCENKRNTDSSEYTCYKAGGNFQGDPIRVSQFSSRGPTKEGRIKPDVVAPGSMILSTASSYAPSTSKYGVWPEKEWSFMSGTSMATPLVAGCVAVIRQRLKQKSPNLVREAALIKAIVINGANDLNLPREHQGFGRVDIVASHKSITQETYWLSMTRGRPAFQKTIRKALSQAVIVAASVPQKSDKSLATDSWRQKSIDPLGKYLDAKQTGASGSVTLKVTLVYTDMPGGVLQINLNLVVACRINGKWEYWRGNANSKGLSRKPDRKNNVEQVTWKNLPPNTRADLLVGTYKFDTFRQRKHFAVVWSVTPSTAS